MCSIQEIRNGIPFKLNDYFDIPEELKTYINEWKFIFVDVKEIDTSKIKDEQTRYFYDYQEMYKGNFKDYTEE